MIEIRSHFTTWHKASREQAERYVKLLMCHMVGVPQNRRPTYINTHYLRGITVDELLKLA